MTTTLPDLFVGQTATFSKTIAECDVYQFAGITGDFNPVHVDAEYAATTRFGNRLVHGMLTSAFICTVLGTALPGVGTIHVSQTLEFLLPVFIGDTVTITLTVKEIIPENRLAVIDCSIRNQHQQIVVKGIAAVKPPQPIEGV